MLRKNISALHKTYWQMFLRGVWKCIGQSEMFRGGTKGGKRDRLRQFEKEQAWGAKGEWKRRKKRR